MLDRCGSVWLVVLLISVSGVFSFSACHRDGSLAGDRCKVTKDCVSPLVCSTKADPDAVEGICVYPDALPVDAGIQDAAGSVDTGKDDATAAVDASPPDVDVVLDGGVFSDASFDVDALPDSAR